MALVGTEVLEVQGVAANGMLSGQTFQTTTRELAQTQVTKGTFTITGATAVTVNNANVTSASIISFTLRTVGGTVGAYPAIKTITPGTGFTVAATTADVSVYNYSIDG